MNSAEGAAWTRGPGPRPGNGQRSGGGRDVPARRKRRLRVAWSRESSAVSGSTRSRSRWEVGAFTVRAGELASTSSTGEPTAEERRFTVRRRRTELQGCGGRTRRGDPHRRHHVATRRVLDRLQLGDELQRFLLGETEEPRKHLGLVLGRRGCDAARDRPCLLRGRPEGRSRTRTPAERCVRSLLARWCPAKRARAEIASSDPLGSLERDCSGPYKSERARRSRRRTGFLRADPRGRGSRARNRPGRPPSSLPFCTTAEQSAPRAQCRRKGVPVEM
jgi:hypothetical protein